MRYFIVVDNTILPIRIEHSEFAAYMFLLLFKLEGELLLLSFFCINDIYWKSQDIHTFQANLKEAYAMSRNGVESN